MRWSIIRLVWLREMRDQLRDRRTVFMIAGVPLLLYPVLGVCVLAFATQFFERPSRIGLPKAAHGERVFPADDGPDPIVAAAAVADAAPISPLGFLRTEILAGVYRYAPFARGERLLVTAPEAVPGLPRGKTTLVWLERGGEVKALADGEVDVVLALSPRFLASLAEGERNDRAARPPVAASAVVELSVRPGDDRSRQAANRARELLSQWRDDLRRTRFLRSAVAPDFDQPFTLKEPRAADAAPAKLTDVVIRIFPFLLVVWSLAGALYPAVDLCAGEKERGTMETLLITPAGRDEIVVAKFLAIWVFSASSALLNLLSMGLTTWRFASVFPREAFSFGAVAWCVLLALPLAALFSAVSLAIGAYARSSKEGQYYLMPLFLLTMPLVFVTMAPGVELNPFYSLVPVTGVALLMQKLMTAPGSAPWLYFIPVLAPVALYSALALRWAIDQFHREEVLFREAERLDVGLWLKSVFREKEPTPSTGQAYFLFALLMGLAWISLGFAPRISLWVFTTIDLLAFVATPTLMMALLLTTSPGETLKLRLPRTSDIALAALFGVLTLAPLIWAGQRFFADFPHLRRLLDDPHPFVREILALTDVGKIRYLTVFAILPAVCEELAFRGYLLTGLCRRSRPRTAILLCAFLGALFHMNVFTFVPIFALGVVLGLVTVRSGSIVPAIVLHFVSKGGLIASRPLTGWIEATFPSAADAVLPLLAFACAGVAFALAWRLYRQPYQET